MELYWVIKLAHLVAMLELMKGGMLEMWWLRNLRLLAEMSLVILFQRLDSEYPHHIREGLMNHSKNHSKV